MKLKALLTVGSDIRIFLRGHSEVLKGTIADVGDDYLVIDEKAYRTIIPRESIAFMTSVDILNPTKPEAAFKIG